MLQERAKELQALAAEVRKDLVRMVGVARSGSIEPPLSVADVIVYLYCERMDTSPKGAQIMDRDRFFLGMGAAVPALYAVLARRGYFDRGELWHYKRLGALLQPLPDYGRVPGIDAPCVLSASELAIASGLAEVQRDSGLKRKLFCLIGQEDCFSEDFWFEVAYVGRKKSDSIVLLLIAPLNGADAEKAAVDRYRGRFIENGWEVVQADGHDFFDMEKALGEPDSRPRRPKAVFLSTDIGKGLSLAERQRAKYSRLLSLQEMDSALEELENGG